MTFRLLYNSVLIRRLATQKRIASGIVIPDIAQEKPVEGEIVTVVAGLRPEHDDMRLGLKTGDHILFGKWSGVDVRLDGEELLILKQSEILGIVC